MLHRFKIAILLFCLVMPVGCSSSLKQPVVCPNEEGDGSVQRGGCRPARHAAFPEGDMADRLALLERERHWLEHNQERLEMELETAKRRNVELEQDIDLSKGSLVQVEQDLMKAFKPEIANGTMSVRQFGEALTIILASGLLFDSGQDQLKARGIDVVRRVGSILKDFPDKNVHVACYTNNVTIRRALKKKYHTDKELSDARAKNTVQALREGRVNSHLSVAGHGNSDPIASNNTAAGRAKNRRIEIIVS